MDDSQVTTSNRLVAGDSLLVCRQDTVDGGCGLKRSQSIPVRMMTSLCDDEKSTRTAATTAISCRRALFRTAVKVAEPHQNDSARVTSSVLHHNSAANRRRATLAVADGWRHDSLCDSPAGLLMRADPSTMSLIRRRGGPSFDESIDILAPSPHDDSVFENSQIESRRIVTPVMGEGGSTKSFSPDAKDTLAIKLGGLAPLASIESFPADSDLPLTPPSVQKSSPSTAATFIADQTAIDMSAAVFSDPLNSAAALKGGGDDTSGQTTTTADDDITTSTKMSPMHRVDSCSSTSRAAAADERRKALIERRPFEDDPDLYAAGSKSTANGQSSFGTPFGGAALFGRIGREMLGRFSTRNSPGPTEDSLGPQTTPRKASVVPAHGSMDSSSSPPLQPSTATAFFTPTSSNSAAAWWSPQASAGTPGSASASNLTRLLKSGVSSMVHEIKTLKGNLVEQVVAAAGSPALRSSLSSLALAADVSSSGAYFAGVAPTVAPNGAVDSNYNDDVVSDDAASTSTVDCVECREVAIEESLYHDQAFHLSNCDALDTLLVQKCKNFNFNNPVLCCSPSSANVAHVGAERLLDGASGSSAAAVVIDVALCSCTRCPHCLSFCFDDEIMAGWSPDDSELTARCQFCSGKFVPQLTVAINLCRLSDRSYPDSWYVRSATTDDAASCSASNNLFSILNADSCCSVSNNDLNSKESGCLMGSTPSNQSVYSPHFVERPSGAGEKSGARNYGSVDRLNVAGYSCKVKQMPRPRANSLLNLPNSNARQTTDPKRLADSFNTQRMTMPNPTNSNDDNPDFFGLDEWAPRENSHIDSSPNNPHEKYFNVPFLCPIVLRKELETVVSSEGDDCLSSSTFVDQHPIIYWNLLYFFQRIASPTHLPTWLPDHFKKTMIFDHLYEKGDFPPIFVRCVYDLAYLHKDDPAKPLLAPFSATGKSETPSHEPAVAMDRSRTILSTSDLGGSGSSLAGAGEPGLARALLLSEHRPVSKSVVSQIVECIMAPNLHKPITLMINEHRKRAPPSRQTGTSPSTPLLPRHFSIYRDVFLLAIGCYGKHLRVDEFEKEYESSFSKLPPKIAAMLPTKDKAPALNVRACRKIFLPLDAR